MGTHLPRHQSYFSHKHTQHRYASCGSVLNILSACIKMHRAALIKNKKKIEINIAVAFRETSQRATLCFEAAETQSQWLWWSCVIQHHYSSALLDEVSLFRIIYLTASPLQSMFDGNQMWGILHQGLLEHKRSVASTAKWKGVFIYLCIHLFKEPPQCLWLLKKYFSMLEVLKWIDTQH